MFALSDGDCVRPDHPHAFLTMTDDELVRRLEDGSLSPDEWTHRAHIRVAYCYLERFGFDGALERLRSVLQAYNVRQNVPDEPTRGYNETITVAFLRIVHATMRAYGGALPTADGESFCETHPHLLHKELLRLYYSPDRRMDPQAKRVFLEPDLAPLPDVSEAV